MKKRLAQELRSKLEEVNVILEQLNELGLECTFTCTSPSCSQKCGKIDVRVFETKEY